MSASIRLSLLPELRNVSGCLELLPLHLPHHDGLDLQTASQKSPPPSCFSQVCVIERRKATNATVPRTAHDKVSSWHVASGNLMVDQRGLSLSHVSREGSHF